MVDGECMDENKIEEDDKTCTRRKCVRREVDNESYGEYVMVDKGKILILFLLNLLCADN